MDSLEVKYILDHFPRLMTSDERSAKYHHIGMFKLGAKEKYATEKQYESKKKWLLDRGFITEKEHIISLTKKGYQNFLTETAERIARESPNDFCINRCPKCDFIARTPYAKQCRKCYHNWRKEVKAEFRLKEIIKKSESFVFTIVGEILSGVVESGLKIDLTNFQMNLFPEINSVEEILNKEETQIYYHLNLKVNEKEAVLITKYLKPSAKNIMIIDRK